MNGIRDDGTFLSVFQAATALHGDEIGMPRLTTRQRNRSNVPASSAQEYYRRAVFLPFVDCCMAQMKERFNKQALTACQLTALLPSHCANSDFREDIEPAGTFYSKFMPSGNTASLQMEFLRWQKYWNRQSSESRPETAVEALRAATQLGTYPAICVLLQIFATLPVTTATGERSFSALKYLKNYLRSTMNEDRLNGLAHLYINRDIRLDYGMVVDQFARFNRRLSFV